MTLVRVIPALPVSDISAAVAFYRDRLGFDPGYSDDDFAILTRDEVEIHLWAASDASWRERSPSDLSSTPVVSGAESFIAGTASCRIEVRDIDLLYSEYADSGVLYDSNTTIESQPWGTREFPALDLERNLLTFYQPLPGH